jgi:glycosyltransferase involved in cell wall biosynthesis
MERSKNLTLFFEPLRTIHFGKDPILVPYTLGKKLNCSVTIVYFRAENNLDLSDTFTYKGIKLIPLERHGTEKTNFRIRYCELFKYIWSHANEIDVMMRFFDNRITELCTCIYKYRNPKGKVYVKMDVNPFRLMEGSREKTLIPEWLNPKNCLTHSYHKGTTVISCESSIAFNFLKKRTVLYAWGNKLLHIPNGFDEEFFNELSIAERKYSEKENIIITVARNGTPQKNTEMILRMLPQLRMNGWKCYLIGSIEPDFQQKVEDFYRQYPHLKEDVIFTGNIDDKKVLWEYYNRAKVFILSSRFESYCLALNEAKRFGNYIISTHVGASDDIIQEKYGEYVEQDDDVAMATKIQNVIDGKTDIAHVYDGFDGNVLSWDVVLDEVAQRLK